MIAHSGAAGPLPFVSLAERVVLPGRVHPALSSPDDRACRHKVPRPLYTGGFVSGAVLTRTNLFLEIAKVRSLRKSLQSRGNSEAVRVVIDERLAVGGGLQALRRLRKLGGLKDTFGRTRAKRA
jgi:hypothetical protein